MTNRTTNRTGTSTVNPGTLSTRPLLSAIHWLDVQNHLPDGLDAYFSPAGDRYLGDGVPILAVHEDLSRGARRRADLRHGVPYLAGQRFDAGRDASSLSLERHRRDGGHRRADGEAG